MAKVKVFHKKVKLQGQSLWYHMKGIVTRNTYVQYKSPTSSGLKVMANVKVFQKYVKLQGQGHKVKIYGSMWKVLSQGIHMCNMKALPLLVWKLWPRLKFLSTQPMRTPTRTPTLGLWHKLPRHSSRLAKNVINSSTCITYSLYFSRDLIIRQNKYFYFLFYWKHLANEHIITCQSLNKCFVPNFWNKTLIHMV